MKVAVIGAKGFVGSAFCRFFRSGEAGDIELAEVTPQNYLHLAGNSFDVTVECASNSRKFFAEEKPFDEYDQSVSHCLKTLLHYPAKLHLHISSVDVYADFSRPETTREDCAACVCSDSHYGFHKWISEKLITHHAPNWIIFRLAGMVGQGLWKNPVYDMLHQKPLRIHPESRYQFLNTDEVARLCWKFASSGMRNEIINICGTGTVTINEIAEMANRKLDCTELPENAAPRIVDASNEKLRKYYSVSDTRKALECFLKSLVVK